MVWSTSCRAKQSGLEEPDSLQVFNTMFARFARWKLEDRCSLL